MPLPLVPTPPARQRRSATNGPADAARDRRQAFSTSTTTHTTADSARHSSSSGADSGCVLKIGLSTGT